jgi:hypothetical protein
VPLTAIILKYCQKSGQKYAAGHICLFLQNILYDLRYCILILLLLAGLDVNAQVLKGNVMDAQTRQPLSPVTIVNLNTQQSTYTDDKGNFVLPAKTGDQIWFSYVGYHNTQQVTPPGIGVAEIQVGMFQQNFELQEYVLHNYTPYQLDSIEMAALYNKELNTTPIKPTVGFNNGIAVNGLIGSAVQKMSRSYKRNKRFKKEFEQIEEEKFIDTRYTPELVASLTGFSGDSLAYFINAYPMDYDFARTASDLELKMWIRYNYREYVQKKNLPLAPLADKARSSNQ